MQEKIFSLKCFRGSYLPRIALKPTAGRTYRKSHSNPPRYVVTADRTQTQRGRTYRGSHSNPSRVVLTADRTQPHSGSYLPRIALKPTAGRIYPGSHSNRPRVVLAAYPTQNYRGPQFAAIVLIVALVLSFKLIFKNTTKALLKKMFYLTPKVGDL